MNYREASKRKAGGIDPQNALILAIETSCDETAAAVVRGGTNALSSAIHSQIQLHKKFGGVVPELASRSHVEKIRTVVEDALYEAGATLEQIDAIAVTYGPGLVGALLIGVSYAKSLAFAKGLPLLAVNHIAGHIAANYLCGDLKPPFICLVVSGGHSHIVLVKDFCSYELLGCTRDDAAGEAFDKIARTLGLPYPGGPNVEQLAKQGNPAAHNFKAPFNLKEHYDFSFSGIKTAVINYVHTAQQRNEQINLADVAASFQESLVSALCDKTVRAAQNYGLDTIAVAGGVSSNGALRQKLGITARESGLKFYCPKLEYCTDNAAMIACAGWHLLQNGLLSGMNLNAEPALKLC